MSLELSNFLPFSNLLAELLCYLLHLMDKRRITGGFNTYGVDNRVIRYDNNFLEDIDVGSGAKA